MSSAHEEEMYRIVTNFLAACAAPTRRFRRILCAVCLGVAAGLIAIGAGLMHPLHSPLAITLLWCLALALLAVALRLALNDVRDVRDQYRRTRRDLFVATFSDEEFQRKVREKRKKLKAADPAKKPDE